VQGIKKAFLSVRREIEKQREDVKSEMDDHREAINENTADIQELNNALSEFDKKIDKLFERLDEAEMILHPKKLQKIDISLTPREQEVFMALYLGKEMTLIEIAKRLGFTTDMVNLYIFNLVSKGVPIKKELMDDVLVFSLDAEFRELQARRNILDIDQRIMRQLA
jgi:flagellar hook-associated protein FlgK